MVKDDVQVRIARREDVPALVALLTDDILGRDRDSGADLTPYYEAFDELYLEPTSDLLVLDLDGRVVGTAQLTYTRGLSRGGMRRCTVEAVRVAGDLRGQGLGQVLMDSVLDLARARGCAVVQLTTDKRRSDAHRFYRRLGFVDSHEGMKLYL